jgi:hypothetical protein
MRGSKDGWTNPQTRIRHNGVFSKVRKHSIFVARRKRVRLYLDHADARDRLNIILITKTIAYVWTTFIAMGE